MPYRARVHEYRDRAEELRIIAQDFSDKQTQRILTGLAIDYERMAEELERNKPHPLMPESEMKQHP